jgi:hypothetical protein
MAVFTLKRPNASLNDLRPADAEQVQKLFDLFLMTKARMMQFERAAIIQFYYEFGFDRVAMCIERWAMLGYFSLDSLHGLLTGKIPMQRKHSVANETPGQNRIREQHQPTRIAEMMQQSLRQPMTELPPFVMSEDDAIRYIVAERHADPEHLLDFFNYFGRNSSGKQFFQLKQEYR